MNIATFGNFLGPDTLIIFLVILLLFGAKKLPELARGMGQAVREFSKAKDEIEREVTRAPAPEPPRQIESVTPQVAQAAQVTQQPAAAPVITPTTPAESVPQNPHAVV